MPERITVYNETGGYSERAVLPCSVPLQDFVISFPLVLGLHFRNNDLYMLRIVIPHTRSI